MDSKTDTDDILNGADYMANPMDSKTLEALEKSIAHWEDNVKAERPEDAPIGNKNCALCNLFLKRKALVVCDGCPVYQHTGKIVCEETPYRNAFRAWVKCDKQLFKHHAQEMTDFLKSLLPEQS